MMLNEDLIDESSKDGINGFDQAFGLAEWFDVHHSESAMSFRHVFSHLCRCLGQ